jgi:hypothetical protein
MNCRRLICNPQGSKLAQRIEFQHAPKWSGLMAGMGICFWTLSFGAIAKQLQLSDQATVTAELLDIANT